jgi:hypothetical protein
MFPETGEKKTLTKFGEIEIANDHPFSQGQSGYQISPLLQGLMIYAGQLDCYDNCNEVLQQFLNIEVNAAQVFRVTNTYGEAIAEKMEPEQNLPLKKEEVLYAGADGSMILTREEGWKEVKLGRLFKASDCLHMSENRGWIKHSQYIAHLGNSRRFTCQMEEYIDAYGPLKDKLVFISDGAVWIRNWINDSYPQAIQILDYFHASEHLYSFCNDYFSDKEQGRIWAKQQETLLQESCTIEVIQNIFELPADKKTEKQREQLMQYYQSNKERMDYKRYRQIGSGIIGSGAIEAAHRTVVQKRMKQSGQRWSKKGAQHILNLRTIQMSDQWNKVIALVKTGIKRAA